MPNNPIFTVAEVFAMGDLRRMLPRAVREIRKSDLFKSLEWALRDHRGDGMLDDETAVADAFADLRHIADKQRVDWDSVVRRGEAHYEAEVSDGPQR